MKAKHVLIGAAVLIPAILLPLASCDDSKVPTDPAVDQPADLGPDFFAPGGAGRLHDSRSQAGQQIRTFEGYSNGTSALAGSAKRFKTKDGAEVNTRDTQNGSAYYAGVYPATNRIKGKKVGDVKELDYSFAGEGYDTWLQLPIDEDDDGDTDYTIHIYAYNCNDDGDVYVGTMEADDNQDCEFYYGGTNTWYNKWEDFVNDPANSDLEIAKEAEEQDGPSVWVGGGHVTIWKVDIR